MALSVLRFSTPKILLSFFLCFLFFYFDTAASSFISTDSTQKIIVREVVLIGNRRTRDRLLLRELIFHSGDTLSEQDLDTRIKKSTENLNNTLLFNTVNIEKAASLSEISTLADTVFMPMDIYVFVTERWYIFPAPIFELGDRNFNEWWKTKDFSRTIYGGYLYWNNFRGRNETLVVGSRWGYTQELTLSYNIPYINSKQVNGLAISYSYNRNHEVGYQTYENKLDYFSIPDRFLKREWQAGVQYSHRHAIYNTYYISLNEHYVTIDDTIAHLNPSFLLNGKTQQRSASLRFLFRHDRRDNVNYPLVGNYYDLEVIKTGFSFLDDDVNFWYFTSQYKHFWSLWKHFYFAAGVKGKFSGNDLQPYYNIRGFGYNGDYLRGYEYYVIDGQKYILAKTDLKYELLPLHYVKANFIPTEKFSLIPYSFYFNVYADYGYVQDKQFAMYNPMSNSNLYSWGAGIDFATYYNFVLRLEYSINKREEKGIFVHFTAPI